MMAYSASIFVGTDRQPHIVHQHIRGGNRVEQRGACGPALQIQHDAALVTIEIQELGGGSWRAEFDS